MKQYAQVRRVTVIADSMLEKPLLQAFLTLGARGYNIIECRGKGEHGLVDNPLGGKSAEIRIEVIVQPEIADKIFDYLQRDVFTRHAVTATIDTVEVARAEQF